MNPEQRPCCDPLFKCAALDEPFGSPIVLDRLSNVMVLGRIRRGEPTPDILLQLVSCEARGTISLEDIMIGASNGSRFVLFSWLVTS